MENSQVIDWILKNKKGLKLQVIHLTGLSEILVGFFDYAIEIFIEGKKYTGRGTDRNEEIAFLKAFSEAFERYFVEDLKLENTSGLSVHSDQFECVNNAKLELIERDVFLCHFLLNGKLNELISDETRKIQSDLIRKKIEIKFYSLLSEQSLHCVVAFVGDLKSKLSDKLIFGVGCKRLQTEAVEHAAVESIRDYIDYHEDPKSISLSSFENLKEWSFVDHKNLGRNKVYSEEYFASRIHELKIKIDYINDIKTNEIKCDKIFDDFPLCAFRASCEKAQSLWVGKTSNIVINHARLHDISPNQDYCMLPHFFN